ncbi:MAG: glycosyltransferase, partial [Candidatus Delongbacteria bacterium]|nr:glycosyltransferase [Candidatus Delongbacteria bacterium]
MFGILHSYLFFPLLLKWKTQGKSFDAETFTEKTNLPSVSIIIAAYNEEAVIEEKVNSIFQNDYPSDKFEVLIGSDNSTDSTNEICLRLSEKHNNLHFTSFKQRQGKIPIINKLEKQAKSPILIFTDANVIFDNNSIYELIKYFKNDDIGLIDSHMINTGLKKEGISFQEKSYISREVYIKHREGLLWGSMMGPFGG